MKDKMIHNETRHAALMDASTTYVALEFVGHSVTFEDVTYASGNGGRFDIEVDGTHRISFTWGSGI